MVFTVDGEAEDVQRPHGAQDTCTARYTPPRSHDDIVKSKKLWLRHDYIRQSTT